MKRIEGIEGRKAIDEFPAFLHFHAAAAAPDAGRRRRRRSRGFGDGSLPKIQTAGRQIVEQNLGMKIDVDGQSYRAVGFAQRKQVRMR